MRRLWLAVLAVSVACAASDPRAEAVGVLVDRGMERGVAECTVERLEQRGVELDSVGDGLVDPSQQPEVVEAVAACAVVLAADAEESAEGA